MTKCAVKISKLITTTATKHLYIFAYFNNIMYELYVYVCELCGYLRHIILNNNNYNNIIRPISSVIIIPSPLVLLLLVEVVVIIIIKKLMTL